jgi:hypothetical protein
VLSQSPLLRSWYVVVIVPEIVGIGWQDPSAITKVAPLHARQDVQSDPDTVAQFLAENNISM